MPTHWHLVIVPGGAMTLPRFMHRMTTLHARKWHLSRGTTGTGPVYQGRYKAVGIATERHLLTACRYVERNPLVAGLVSRAEDWRWSSAWRRHHHCAEPLLSEWPVTLPTNWLELLNQPSSKATTPI